MSVRGEIETGDNSQVIVSGYGGRIAFDLAMQLIFAGQAATHYAIKKIDHEKPTRLFEDHVCMIFYWWGEKDTTPLPYKMNAKEAADLAWGWLEKQDYGPEPDHDGSSSKGWSIFNESWGHVGNSRYAFCAVSPQWIWYGK